MSSSKALRDVFTAARPLVEQWLDVGEQIAALREVATAKGLDWSQVKALLKAQIQDERDEKGDGKRVARIVEKAEFASAYADMLGLGPNMNEKKYSAAHDPETGELAEHQSDGGAIAAVKGSARFLANAAGVESSPSDTITHPQPTSQAVPQVAAISEAGAPVAAASPLHSENIVSFERKPYVLRPNCLRPENCGGYGSTHCGACATAAQKSGAA